MTTFGEWAVFTVERERVVIDYYRVDGNEVNDGTVNLIDGYSVTLECVGTGENQGV